MVFNDTSARPDTVCQIVAHNAADFIKANEEPTQRNGMIREGTNEGVSRWQRPRHGWVKINFDGGIERDSRQRSLVIRDWQGRFIAARAVHRHHVTDPLVVEALVARESLQFAWELGMDNIVLEGDSQQLVRMIQRRTEEHQTVGVIVADILRYLGRFSSSETKFVKRSAMGLPIGSLFHVGVQAPFMVTTWYLLSSLQGNSCTL